MSIGATGFEPAAFWSQTRRSTKLSYAPDPDQLIIFAGLLEKGKWGEISIFRFQIESNFHASNGVKREGSKSNATPKGAWTVEPMEITPPRTSRVG